MGINTMSDYRVMYHGLLCHFPTHKVIDPRPQFKTEIWTDGWGNTRTHTEQLYNPPLTEAELEQLRKEYEEEQWEAKE